MTKILCLRVGLLNKPTKVRRDASLSTEKFILTTLALTLGAGVQWHEAYDAAEANGRFVLGGLSAGASVGAAGGWVQGGGHSAFSARHGLGMTRFSWVSC